MVISIIVAVFQHDVAAANDPGMTAAFYPMYFQFFLSITTVIAIVIVLLSAKKRLKAFQLSFCWNSLYYVLVIMGALLAMNIAETRVSQVTRQHANDESSPYQVTRIEKLGYGMSRLTFRSKRNISGESYCYLSSGAAKLLQDGQQYSIQKAMMTRSCDQIQKNGDVLYGFRWPYLGYGFWAILVWYLAYCIRARFNPFLPKEKWHKRF